MAVLPLQASLQLLLGLRGHLQISLNRFGHSAVVTFPTHGVAGWCPDLLQPKFWFKIFTGSRNAKCTCKHRTKLARCSLVLPPASLKKQIRLWEHFPRAGSIRLGNWFLNDDFKGWWKRWWHPASTPPANTGLLSESSCRLTRPALHQVSKPAILS